MRAAAVLRGLPGDFRIAARSLMRAPGFAFIALLSLALGIGANTAIFSLVNAILLRSLPLPDPQELRVVTWTGTNPRSSGAGPKIYSFSGAMDSDGAGHVTANAVSFPVFSDLRAATRGLADVFAHFSLHSATLRAGRAAFVANGAMVSDNFFTALGVRPWIGRLPSVEDGREGAGLVAVISNGLWQREYGSDPAVAGRTIDVNGQAVTVIGVLPAGFSGVRPADDLAFYVPLSAQPALQSSSPHSSWSRTAPDVWWLELMARVRPGTSAARFRAALDLAFSRTAGEIMAKPRMVVEDGRRGPGGDYRRYRAPLLLLLGVVSLVLLVACANLAGLSLARGAARQHEYAVRAAIGAGRWRLARQTLAESLLLALLGGALGVVIALQGKAAIARLLSGSPDGLHYDTSLDLTVLSFTLLTALVTALLSGLLPAWRAAGADPLAGLKERAALTAPRLRASRLLVVAQIALSLLLLTGAGLYVRTLLNLVHIDPGFATENLLLFRLDPAARGYRDSRITSFYDEVEHSLARIPGVRSVALTQHALLSGVMSGGGGFDIPGHVLAPTASAGGTPAVFSVPQAHRLTVSESFFTTMGIPVLLGRAFRASDDAGTPEAVVVNEAFAHRYLPGENPVGQTIHSTVGGSTWQIVGVSGDAKYTDIRGEAPPTIYFPFRQNPPNSAYMAVRTALPPLALGPAVRRAVAAIDPDVPVAELTTQALVAERQTGKERLFATLVSALAGLTVLLAFIGLYGLVAYNVTRRTGEIGLRAALGATRRQIAGPILRDAFRLAVLGAALGVPLALALSKLIRRQLYGVGPHDPLTLLAAVMALFAVSLAAAWLPSWRAARLDPMSALRRE